MVDVKELVTKIKEEMEKLKDIDDAKVKEVVTKVSEYVKEVEDASVEEVKDVSEEVDEEEKKEEISEETEEEKEETDENGAEEKVQEEEKSEVKEDKPLEKELSAAIASKLQQAAIELSKAQKEIEAKEEIINGYKTTITELQKEIDIYKEKEKLELKKRFDAKISNLVELYRRIGIDKQSKELELNFSEDQIDKLINDLSAIQLNTQKSQRVTKVSDGLELNKYVQKKEKPINTAETIFNDMLGE